MVLKLTDGNVYALQNDLNGSYLKCYKDSLGDMKLVVTEPEDSDVQQYGFIKHHVKNQPGTILFESMEYPGNFLTWKDNVDNATDAYDNDDAEDDDDLMLFLWTVGAKGPHAQWSLTDAGSQQNNGFHLLKAVNGPADETYLVLTSSRVLFFRFGTQVTKRINEPGQRWRYVHLSDAPELDQIVDHEMFLKLRRKQVEFNMM